jgi:CRISPR-associated protein Csm1
MVSARSHRLAALLYDIGRLRATIDDGHSTGDSEVERPSIEFLRALGDDDAARIVEAYHAESDECPVDLRKETQILVAASRLASSVADSDSSVPTDRLSSVFTPLTNRDPATSKTYPLQPLSLDQDTLFPCENSEHTNTIEEGYRRLWDGLTDEITEGAAYETVVYLVEKYTWCVPSDADSSDLPLYDRLRTTAAISEALHRADLTDDDLARLAEGKAIDTDTKLFSLVKGDISGIQAFLHRMRNPDEAQDRVSKRVRGRSTQLWLLTEGLNRLFLRRLDLPITNMIWSGGGQFYALVPSSVDDALESFETEVNRWLLDRFDGDLFFVLGSADARRADAGSGFATLFRRVASDTDAGKLRKGASAISTLDTPVLGEAKEPCAACGGDKERGDDRCNECAIQEDIGQDLPRATHLSLDFSEHADAHFTLDLPRGGASWRLVESVGSEETNADRLYSLNRTEMPQSSGVTGFVFTGTTVPVDGSVDGVWSFAEQADLGRSDALHVAKMDIDGLGNAITSAMEGGLSRLAALSRSLELFFSGYVNEIAEEMSYLSLSPSACDECRAALSDATTREVEHWCGTDRSDVDEAIYYRLDADSQIRSYLHESCVETVSPIYIGFSGGDDMFFVGPWDEAITFGRSVHEIFHEYTSKSFTLSAGFFLTHPKYPIGRATENAEDRLGAAKEFSYGNETKNAVSLFGETLGWELDGYPGMNTLVDFGQRFEELLQDEELSQSTLHALSDLHDETYPNGIPPDPNDVSIGTRREWKLKYLLVRNVDQEVMDELEESIPGALPWITVPVSWASLATRN